jgi:predicted acetyltransferase
MVLDVRPLAEADQADAWRLGSLAFGYRERTMPEGWTSDTPGRHTLGGFAGGQLVAKAVDREQPHWFGGRLVPGSGVAGVAVAAESRGQGYGQIVLTRLLATARERGAVVSTLFPTTPFVYRSLGWEQCGQQIWVDVPTASLAAVRVPAGIRLRPAMAADVPAMQELFREQARAGTAVMDRGGPIWARYSDEEYLAQYDGASVAVAADATVVGYTTWDRSEGKDASSRVTADDLVARTPDGLRALLALFGGWASTAPTLRLNTWSGDPAQLFTVIGHAPVHSGHPWMLRLVDARAAVAARGWPGYLSGVVDLELADEVCPWNAGPYRLVLDGGSARLEPGGPGGARLTPRGAALWYAGAVPPPVLRQVGLLTGPDGGDELLGIATAGPAPRLHDYF